MSECFTDIGPIPANTIPSEGGGFIPDLGTLAWKSTSPDTGVIRQYDILLNDLTSFPTFGTEIFRLTFDDDGNAYRAEMPGIDNATIWKRALTSTGAGTLLATITPDVSVVSNIGMRWNPYDGQLYVKVQQTGDDRLDRIDPVSGAVTTLVTGIAGSSDTQATPTFTPDGGVWFAQGVSPWDVYRYDIPSDTIAVGLTDALGNQFVAMPDTSQVWYHFGSSVGGGRSINPAMIIADEDCADAFAFGPVNNWSTLSDWSKVVVTTAISGARVLIWPAPEVPPPSTPGSGSGWAVGW